MATLADWLSFRCRHEEIKKALEKTLLECEHSVSLNEFYTLYFLSKSEDKALAIQDLSPESRTQSQRHKPHAPAV